MKLLRLSETTTGRIIALKSKPEKKMVTSEQQVLSNQDGGNCSREMEISL
jgi:hypothetical protein